MWIFTRYGMLFVSAVDIDDARRYDWELQIRARDRKVLERLRRFYIEGDAGYEFSTHIYATPERDYEYRFYTTKAAFSEAMDRLIGEITEAKFKPTVQNDRVRQLYTHIWSIIAHHYDSPILGRMRRTRKTKKSGEKS